MTFRSFLNSAGLVGSAGAIATLMMACSPSTETSREKGVTDSNGYALLQASSASDNHHFSVDVSLRSAPIGTYALLYSTTEPKDKGGVVLRSSDSAVRCASGHGRECVHSESNSVILSIAKVGPGGTGVLRTTFDVGSGGWFAITRVVDSETPVLANASLGPASYDIVIVSEAIAKDEEAQRFVIVTHKPN